jgi:hypothetical protein
MLSRSCGRYNVVSSGFSLLFMEHLLGHLDLRRSLVVFYVSATSFRDTLMYQQFIHEIYHLYKDSRIYELHLLLAFGKNCTHSFQNTTSCQIESASHGCFRVLRYIQYIQKTTAKIVTSQKRTTKADKPRTSNTLTGSELHSIFPNAEAQTTSADTHKPPSSPSKRIVTRLQGV